MQAEFLLRVFFFKWRAEHTSRENGVRTLMTVHSTPILVVSISDDLTNVRFCRVCVAGITWIDANWMQWRHRELALRWVKLCFIPISIWFRLVARFKHLKTYDTSPADSNFRSTKETLYAPWIFQLYYEDTMIWDHQFMRQSKRNDAFGITWKERVVTNAFLLKTWENYSLN